MTLEQTSVLGDHIIKVSESASVSITNFTARNLLQTVIYSKKVKYALIAYSEFESCNQAMLFDQSTVNLMSMCNFDSNGAGDLVAGGAIQIQNSDINIINSNFTRNIAETGAAISFQCATLVQCQLNLTETVFNHNQASEKGGAIFYNYNRPLFRNVTYLNNSAQYGPDIASYAVKITFNDSFSNSMSINNMPSGLPYPNAFTLVLRDYDNQVMVLNNEKQISLFSSNSSIASVSGINSVVLKNGTATFNDFTVAAQLGLQNVMFRATSKAIDSFKVTAVYGRSTKESLVKLDFRYCQPGEQMSDNVCIECAPGTYSLEWNSTQCEQ